MGNQIAAISRRHALPHRLGKPFLIVEIAIDRLVDDPGSRTAEGGRQPVEPLEFFPIEADRGCACYH